MSTDHLRCLRRVKTLKGCNRNQGGTLAPRPELYRLEVPMKNCIRTIVRTLICPLHHFMLQRLCAKGGKERGKTVQHHEIKRAEYSWQRNGKVIYRARASIPLTDRILRWRFSSLAMLVLPKSVTSHLHVAPGYAEPQLEIWGGSELPQVLKLHVF